MQTDSAPMHPEDAPIIGPLYTTDEVAKLLRLSQRTVQVWIRSGKLVATRCGRLWRISQDDLMVFGNGRTGQPDANSECEVCDVESRRLDARNARLSDTQRRLLARLYASFREKITSTLHDDLGSFDLLSDEECTMVCEEAFDDITWLMAQAHEDEAEDIELELIGF